MAMIDSSIQYLKGVGPAFAKKFEKLGVTTIRDLLLCYPRKYIDYTKPYTVVSAPYDVDSCVRTTVFNLEIEGDGTHPVLIWATQRDPITSRFTHIDFYGVDLDKPVKITVPVEFTGVARGTKVGGKLETYREQIQLMAKPLDMPAKVTIDISGMDVGTTIQIADVKLPEGVKAAYDNNYAIVSVLMPGGDDAAAE